MQEFWTQQIAEYFNVIHFDGLWTFANEAYGELQGELNLAGDSTKEEEFASRRLEASLNDDFNTDWFTAFNENKTSTFYLPFTPQYKEKGPYDQNSASLNATHKNFSYWNTIE